MFFLVLFLIFITKIFKTITKFKNRYSKFNKLTMFQIQVSYKLFNILIRLSKDKYHHETQSVKTELKNTRK